MSQATPRHPSLPRPIVGEIKLERSNQLLAEARKLVPGVTQTMMKKPDHFAPGAFPVFLAKGQGALVEDADGQEYIDYIQALGANMLGHNHPAVAETIRKHLAEGIIHSLPTPVEVSSVRALVDVIPGAEMARFFKTGADATSAAVRLSRHITGRESIVTVGYNGWHDHFMYDTPGIPAAVAKLTTRLPLFSPPDEPALLAHIEAHGAQLACVLLAIPYNRTVTREFLQAVKDTCAKHGVLFVLDEVVTGFRLALGGAQQFFGIQADFVTLSKGIAAGMPLSAIAGPEKYLSKLSDLQVSTTFGGEMLSLAVCEAVLKEYKSTNYIEHIASMGRRLRDGVNAHAKATGSSLEVIGYDAVPFFRFSKEIPHHIMQMIPFQAGMARRGVILRRDLNFISAVHTEQQIDHTIAAAGEVLRELTAGSAASAA
ncbi:aminotransferase class III-fold pyridoxal phosphate-dependent enzyme [Corallococcus praedator]|uniref:Aminotransferase class III-fold pyridoxal phosphate-dependent enzyme n=1 Tax=Corallococcus praedator TaxID=2316724 RepID=A0ABX9Q776_9BACT|nr:MULTISPECIES: myxochelin B biosynthesis transaminase MxcL [Corallococcus]RKH16164.1 aminotransferase class III-fold pyridoxal phosphate-dependent enzyme [Corallococcus sp. CA047B]RKH34983.1 aminotransferase class III-fold pyridoxal phosphate-dependent enzyme [Corallococcus sp. CA031C]RKH93255.1 aminotransferase class III-fold pyridoxal phosphate-dependent enzyme [Corallococcus praedator]